MRSNLERVSVVLTKEQHQRFKELSRKTHGSLSEFIRMAGENATDHSKADVITIRSIIKKLELTSDIIQQIDERLKKTERGTEYLVDKFGNNTDKIADIIEKLLFQRGDLSIPEIGTYLPYTQEEIISSIERLEERFVIVRIRRDAGPSKWKIRGD